MILKVLYRCASLEAQKGVRVQYFKNLYSHSHNLISLPNIVLNQLSNLFYNQYLVSDKQTFIDQIKYTINNSHLQTIQTVNNDKKIEPETILKSFLTIIDYMDRSNTSFLTGDAHAKFFQIFHNEIKQAIEIIEKQGSEVISLQEKDALAQKVIKKLLEDNRQYKVPLLGIKYPELENPRNLFERQLKIEEESNEIAIQKFMQIFDGLQNMKKSQNLQVAQKYVVNWFPVLCQAIKQEQQNYKLKKNNDSFTQYFLSISADKLSVIALSEMIKKILESISYVKNENEEDIQSPMGQTIHSKDLYKRIGQEVSLQYIHQIQEVSLKNHQKEILTELTKDKEGLKDNKLIKHAKRLAQKKLQYSKEEQNSIPIDIQVQIGAVLCNLMRDNVKIQNEDGFLQPLIIQSYKRVKKEKILIIFSVNQEFTKKVIQSLSKDDNLFMHLDRSLPMIYPPAKWEDYEFGGYYQRPTNLLRLLEGSTQIESVKYADLSKIFEVLDTIASIPWQINRKILNVVEQVWEEGGGVAYIPKRHYDFSDFVYEYQIKECYSTVEKMKMQKKLQLQRDEHSLRCDFNLKLSVARAFKDCAKIYFPHNLDFRGRIYPVPPHLNHIGSDLPRGLLYFSQGKPLGPKGLYWLKVHLANKMGKDKLSFPERVEYVDSMMELIKKCAKDPIQNREWTEFEDAWQSLAAMFDYVAALESPDPTKYVSHLHVHMDGSCNGLQHYAAIGRDVDGARQVNLMNTQRPGDVYSHVAGMVEKTVERDSNDPNCKFHEVAKKVVGKIQRRIVKQTVMTSVYGVTFIGAREQIHRQLKDKGILKENDVEQYTASYYLAQITLDAIKNLFSGAHGIKQWLINCAGLIAESQNPVSWITPLGLPVVQPYRTQSVLDYVKTVNQSIAIQRNSNLLPINKSKQRSAFPPNFIHSLDSTHLMYTAVECKKFGITFAAVHDSYWTHACDVESMGEILRKQFVKLHSQPLLEELKTSFEKRFPEIQFPEIPKRGDLDLKNVEGSVYFFA